MMSDLEALLLASCELAQCSPELRRQVKEIQAENALLRAAIRALTEPKVSFDLSADSMPVSMFHRRQV